MYFCAPLACTCRRGMDWDPVRLLLQLIQPTDLQPSQALNP